ncbi:cysteine dioxygenase [Streptomyces kaniharaensis]|uniref:Cysteine dioxygenase n=1 Tax=Streptomyces kaniharaensis TaxID=212423 RepID=A0A6N7KT58_9ACTN|nr:cysteine dioxygenase [Streptomyces kaniharaensis]MQS14822.1 cysteine dioxygenase [Streptomyces kaniharaensis]
MRPTGNDGPTLGELLEFAHRTAADPGVLARLPRRPGERSWISLPAPGGAEAWVIGWPPGAETGWHDHGGSRGAFATASGLLRESSIAVELPTEGWRVLELADGVDRRRELSTGRGRAFGPHHVHQVVNPSRTEHAVSVHVYYPPLPLMRRYTRDGRVLRLTRTEQTQEW